MAEGSTAAGSGVLLFLTTTPKAEGWTVEFSLHVSVADLETCSFFKCRFSSLPTNQIIFPKRPALGR